MSGSNDKKRFSAADIEKYHRGLLTPGEMHAMEKAALEDPLLADAIDGYAFLNSPLQDDLAELQQRLEKRLAKETEARIIPLPVTEKRSRFVWWRVAAAVVLISGLSWAVYQIAFDPHTYEVADAPKITKDLKKTSADSNDRDIAGNPAEITIATDSIRSVTPVINSTADADGVPDTARLPVNNIDDNAAVTAPPEKKAATTNREKYPEAVSPQSELVREDAAKQKELAYQQNRSRSLPNAAPAQSSDHDFSKLKPDKIDSVSGYMNEVAQNNAVRKGNAATIRGEGSRYYIFRGTVVDTDHHPLPFANITNVQDQVGTYADANGAFVLVSTDSLMDVQIKSIGFNNIRQQLKEKQEGNLIEMTADQSLATRVLDTTYRVVNLARLNGLRHEEPEPVDGWVKYDAYVANNLNVPDDVRPKLPPAPTVELSFEVNKLGQPVNIRVVRSLCKECDEEAIRLIKDGPRWKPTARGKRTRITLSF